MSTQWLEKIAVLSNKTDSTAIHWGQIKTCLFYLVCLKGFAPVSDPVDVRVNVHCEH